MEQARIETSGGGEITKGLLEETDSGRRPASRDSSPSRFASRHPYQDFFLNPTGFRFG